METAFGHRCEAEIGVLYQPADPTPAPEREEQILARLGAIAPAVKAWFTAAPARECRAEAVALMAEFLARAEQGPALDPTGSA